MEGPSRFTVNIKGRSIESLESVFAGLMYHYFYLLRCLLDIFLFQPTDYSCSSFARFRKGKLLELVSRDVLLTTVMLVISMSPNRGIAKARHSMWIT